MSQHGATSTTIADPFRFAADGRRIDGEVDVAKLERLADNLADTAGVLRYGIEGSLDEERRPRLRLNVSGGLVLRCQRCLGGLAWPVDIGVTLQPVRKGDEIPDEELEDDEIDALEVGADLDVDALVEDEVLLALPIAPRHDDCQPPRPEGGVEKESPFAKLAALRGGGNKA
ncbi:MAG: metal-binding protein [Betaproteobacteria bacterium]|nr:MAG: metal-binding protein [Betaproteobacteria bacterium]